MRYYEIVLMVHPDFSDHISNMIDRYVTMITHSGGKIHRVEHWGRRQLAYSIKKINKAYYILLNIESSQSILNELNNDFRFNEMIIRNIIMRTKSAITEPSSMIKKKEENQDNNISEIYQKN